MTREDEGGRLNLAVNLKQSEWEIVKDWFGEWLAEYYM